MVFLCGEQDAAKVVAAKGRRRERGVKAVQSFRWEGQSSHACYAAGTGCAQSLGFGNGQGFFSVNFGTGNDARRAKINHFRTPCIYAAVRGPSKDK